jgi:hypothetical protein
VRLAYGCAGIVTTTGAMDGYLKDTCTHDEFVVLGAELQAVLELGSGSAKPHT